MFIAALFTIAKTWKHPKCLSTNGWISKMWYISFSYILEYYSVIKRNNVLIHTTTQMNFKNFLLDEKMQDTEVTY